MFEITDEYFDYLPNELILHICSYFEPIKYTLKETKLIASNLVNLTVALLGNKNNYNLSILINVQLMRLKEIHNYILKYNAYYSDIYCGYEITNCDYKGPPILSDCLSTGLRLPYVRYSFSIFNEEIEKDIIRIIELIPSSISSIYPYMRCREYITPLYHACSNDNIPIRIIELLIKSGANINHKILLNGEHISILNDIERNKSIDRYNQVKTLFEKYQNIKINN